MFWCCQWCNVCNIMINLMALYRFAAALPSVDQSYVFNENSRFCELR